MPKDVIELQDIENWNGEVNTKAGLVLRKKTYGCFNNLIFKVGNELSAAVNNPKLKDGSKVQFIKTILAKYNIYNEN